MNQTQKIYFKPYFYLPDTFVAEMLHLRAFTASRKTSHKFSQASCFEQKIRLSFYACMITGPYLRREVYGINSHPVFKGSNRSNAK